MQNNEEVLTDKRFTKGYIIGLIVSFFITCLIAASIIFLEISLRGLAYEGNQFLIWSDALLVSSILMVLVYCLSWVAAKGAFDIITYAIQTVWFYTWYKEPKKKGKLAANYAEFKADRASKPKTHISFLVLGASPILVAGIIVFILYYIVER